MGNEFLQDSLRMFEEERFRGRVQLRHFEARHSAEESAFQQLGGGRRCLHWRTSCAKNRPNKEELPLAYLFFSPVGFQGNPSLLELRVFFLRGCKQLDIGVR